MALTFEDFGKLWNDIKSSETFPERRPLLAHYTSIPILESILKTNELWFSNPLCMNDIEEVRFGIIEGRRAFDESKSLKSTIKDKSVYQKIIDSFNQLYDRFSNEHAADIYALSLSDHETDDQDGILSMWRGYGGGGSGVAIVFDSKKIPYREGSGLIIAPVTYASKADRVEWLTNKINEFSEIIEGLDLSEEEICIAADSIFRRITIFSLFTKHHGFEEEKEWRIVYLREWDIQKRYESMLHYGIGEGSIEPKLKLNLLQVEGNSGQGLPLTEIVDRIILGPSITSPLTKTAITRMLELTGNGELKDKLINSSIPYRPTK